MFITTLLPIYQLRAIDNQVSLPFTKTFLGYVRPEVTSGGGGGGEFHVCVDFDVD
jgi:hypothetical protein